MNTEDPIPFSQVVTRVRQIEDALYTRLASIVKSNEGFLKANPGAAALAKDVEGMICEVWGTFQHIAKRADDLLDKVEAGRPIIPLEVVREALEPQISGTSPPPYREVISGDPPPGRIVIMRVENLTIQG